MLSGCSDIQVKTLNVLDPSAASEWDKLVELHPNGTVFHRAAWARVIHESYSHKPTYIALFRDTEPVGLIPLIEVLSPFTGRRAICLPFSDACGPLLFHQQASSAMEAELAKLARDRHWGYVEVRGGQLLEQPDAELLSFYGHQLDLGKGCEALFDSFSSATRRAIRRALNSGLNVEILDTCEAVREFYGLHVQTRRRHGLPPQPWRFFMNVHRNLIKTGLGFVVLARDGMRLVAGAIFFRFRRHAIYKFAASDPIFGKKRGNNIVLWEALRYLITQGVEILDLGRTSLQNEGLRRFKLSWGAEEKIIPYYRFEVRRNKSFAASNPQAGFHNRIFRHLPLSMNRVAGAIAYPHLD
jgi:CelD/BcsL family acetyltransferase involved in cellulose biosynthesis